MPDVIVETLSSGIRQMTSTVIASAGRCLVVDPGYFPREVADLDAVARSHGNVRALALTHGHPDRIPGPVHFPGVPVWASDVLEKDVGKDHGWTAHNLRQSRQLEAQWYVQRPAPIMWPDTLHGLAEGERRRIGSISVRAILLPGHSPDGMGLLVEEAGVLLTGDYLCACEIPVLDDFDAYYRTLHRILELVDQGVKEIIPGRGQRLTPEAARAIGAEDLAYLYQLMFFRDSGDIEQAEEMMLPRMNRDKVIRTLHIQNCRKLARGTRM